MKMLGSTEWNLLRRFTREVLTACESDDTGVTADLYDLGLNAAEILGIVWASDSPEGDES